MSPHDGKLVLNGVPSRYDRGLVALEPGYARVDGRGPAELLDFAVRFGELVHFYGLDNRVDGTWAPFFSGDPLTVLPLMAAPGLERSEEIYRRRREATLEISRREPKLQALRRTAQVILDLGRQVDTWLAGLETSGTGDDVAVQALASLVPRIEDVMAPALRRLVAYDKGAGEPDALGVQLLLNYAGFRPLWNLPEVSPDGSIYRGCGFSSKIDNALPAFDPLIDAFQAEMAELVPEARSLLALSLSRADHKPQIALYDAFVRLFETAQETINAISPRYLDFYYRDVLREPRLPAVPDRLYLTFALAEGEEVAEALVPRDTLFPAGEDAEGLEILYGSDRRLAVTDARLERLLTLRAVVGDLYDVEVEGELAGTVRRPLQVERQFWASEVSVAGEQAGDGPPWSTLGEVAPVTTAIQQTASATLGFAVASPYLLLSGGDRSIDLELEITEEYLNGVLKPRLLELVGVTGLSSATIARRILHRGFRFELSTADGWFEVESYEVKIELPRSFRFEVSLPTSVPPIERLFGELEGEVTEGETTATGANPGTAADPAPGRPTLRATLRSQPVRLAGPRATVRVLPLALLGPLAIDDLQLTVSVRGLGELVVANTDGEVDPVAPFPAFGAEPSVGSYLEIRQRELFVKTLDTLQLELAWLGLPQNDDGFRGWYRDYVLGLDGRRQLAPPLFDNQTFRGRFTLRNPGPWELEAGSTEAYLFRSYKDDDRQPQQCRKPEPLASGHLCPATCFGGLSPSPGEVPEYYDPDLGALRLELTDPAYGFGNSIYPSNVLASVVHDLPDPDGCLAKSLEVCADQDCNEWGACMESQMEECMQIASELKYPNEPYLPTVEAVRVCYTAACTAGDGAELFHLAPFDGARPVPAPAPDQPDVSTTLLPDPPPGNLYLGFSRLPPNRPLTLLFALMADAVGRDGRVEEPPPVAWQVLSGGSWLALDPDRVLADRTDGLRHTGIVTLDPPPHAPSDGSELPADLDWLRVGIETRWPPTVSERAARRRLQTEAAGRFPKTAGVHPHAVVASWRSTSSDGAHLAEPLPAHTITASVQELPEIGAVDQPLPSFGGRPAETEGQVDIRVGERLRHKDRAILSWDYERLVLERFPDVWRAGALPTRTPGRGDAPGHVTVVVVPGSEGPEVEDATVPRASGVALREIEGYLEDRTSPFVDLAVVNPVYVRIEVTARVVLVADADDGAGAERLNRDLVAYLSPAFYDAERAARGGAYAFEPDITAFVRSRPYVASLEEIRFAYDPHPETLDWYFLTSAREHRIEIDFDREKRRSERRSAILAGTP